MKRLFVLPMLCLLHASLPAPTWAALDPEQTKPYQLDIVLRIADHRLLTQTFRDRLESEVQAGVQAYFGEIVEVKLLREHPKLKEIDKLGLQLALDTERDLTESKTHFVLVDFQTGFYEVQTRQHDGYTGLPSPTVRREKIDQPALVSKAIVQQLTRCTLQPREKASPLLAGDFGVVATITGKPTATTVQITCKGAKLGTPPTGWVRAGEVFTLVQLKQLPVGKQAVRVPWALLQAEQDAVEGVCTCKLFHRYENPIVQRGDILGYRCLKVATKPGHVQLRLVEANAKTTEPLRNIQIFVHRHGFAENERTKLSAQTDQDGYFRSDKAGADPFEHIAFVRVVGTDGKARAQLPIALFDSGVQVCALKWSGEASSALAIRKDLWEQRVYELLRIQATLFRELNFLMREAAKREQAYTFAKENHEQLNQDMERLKQEAHLLRSETSLKLNLKEGEQRLQEVGLGQQKLADFIKRQEEIVKRENDPARKELRAKVEQARLYEAQADFAKALELYREAVQGGLGDANVTSYVSKLADAWKIAHPEHQEARSFIYELWSDPDLSTLKARTTQASAALATCIKANDTLTPQKLLKVAVSHVDKLKEHIGKLNVEENEDHRKQAQQAGELVEALGKLIPDTISYLEKNAKIGRD